MGTPVSDEDDGFFALPAVLDLTAAEPLHRALLDRVRAGDPLVVAAGLWSGYRRPLSGCSRAATEARSRGNSFLLRDASPVLTDALVDLGVASHLGF